MTDNATQKVSVFGVSLVRIFPHSDSVSLRIQFKCGKIRTRKTPNTDTLLTQCNLIRKTSAYFPLCHTIKSMSHYKIFSYSTRETKRFIKNKRFPQLLAKMLSLQIK